MNRLLTHLTAATTLTLASFNAYAVGFQLLTAEDPGHPDITVGVWYPTARFGMAVAMDAPVETANGGLILLSHGYSGWYAGHANTAKDLAEAGYIVAAPSHTGNTYTDMSSSFAEWAVDRPRHISRVLDQLLADDGFSSHIDSDKIGVYGFSAGGFTVMNLVGGVPDFKVAAEHCKNDPDEYVCAEGLLRGLSETGLDQLPPKAWGHDKRIKAAVIAAPGFGFAYTKESLANISADVQLWSGALDTSVPTNTNAGSIAKLMPKTPETHWVEQANHFAFLLTPCREGFKRENPAEYELVCGDADGFDRREFQAEMHSEMIRFFESAAD